MIPLDDLDDFWKVARPNRLPPEPPIVRPVQFYVGASYRGKELRSLGLVEVPAPEPRHLAENEMHELMDVQDVVPLSGLFYVIEGYFFPQKYCVIDQLRLYRSNESSAQPILRQSFATSGLDIVPPLGVKFKFAFVSL
jgi:hypothetical protein